MYLHWPTDLNGKNKERDLAEKFKFDYGAFNLVFLLVDDPVFQKLSWKKLEIL